MRLLVLCERGGSAGGIETYLQTTLPGLARAGVEFRLLTRDELGWAEEHAAGSHPAAGRLRRVASEFLPDVIALHSVFDAAIIVAARESARSVVYHLHDHRLFCPNGDRVFPQGGARCRLPMGTACLAHSLLHGCAYGPRAKTFELLQLRKRTRDAAARCDRFVVLSAFMHEAATRNGIRAERIVTLAPPLGADFLAPPVQRDLARPGVLFSGRVQPTKGLHSLVQALGRIPDADRPVLTVAGEGPDLERCIALARELQCEVRVLGMLDRAGVIEAIDRSAIVAMPSLWDEPFGLTGIEAFARGRPVAAYRVGAIPEWIGEGGIAVRAGDTRALAGSIQRLLDPRQWGRASAAARIIAERFTLEQHVAALLKAYEFTARSPSRSGG